MTLRFHWFLPTDGDGRTLIGGGHDIPREPAARPGGAAVTPA